MLHLGFVFPGQGSQYIGMGQELASNIPAAAEVFRVADQVLGFQLSALCFEGPAERLEQTEFAQPAILATSIAALAALRSLDLQPVLMAGLSLGEYTALVAAGALSLEEALPLVRLRGRLMQEAVGPGQGSMAAVMGLDDEAVEEICSGIEGYVAIANYNAPKQVVISGESEAVSQAGTALKELGAKVVPLTVSVPSHCHLMYDAAMRLQAVLESLNWQASNVPVVANVNAKQNPSADQAGLLVRQLYSPVKWEQSIRYMLNEVDYFIEIGPGSSLSGLIKRIDRNAMLGNVEDMKSLLKIKEKVDTLCRKA
ncbi:MAG: ACP S-malonyltransferase [Syntrophomonadaceae bacterium]|nr:ACP S-malonyltransferase [Syntrophomonadaceae bacterium]